jgi:hypothetical protein
MCYHRRMRTYLAIALLALAACSSPPKKKGGSSSPIVTDGSDAPENCCCKTSPITSEDGKPVYDGNMNRMECSTKQGECVADVQCQKTTP